MHWSLPLAYVAFLAPLFGTDGEPEAGGLVNTYVRNTTTRTPVYTDVAGATPATNPVVANSLGQVVYYFRDDVQYSWRATSSDGATVLWEADVVSGVVSYTYLNDGLIEQFEESATGNGTTTAYTIEDVVLSSPYQVIASIDGILQNTGAYSVANDGTDTTITFTSAPPNGSAIYLRSFAAQGLAAPSAEYTWVNNGDVSSAVTQAFAANLPMVRMLEGESSISTKITIADGSTSQYSTLNGLTIEGHPARPFLRLNSAGSPLEDIGTRLKWTGSGGGTMMEVLGPAYGINLRNLAFNGDNTNDAATGLRIQSLNRSELIGLTFAGFTGVAFDIDTVDKQTISGTTGEGDQTTDNYVRDLQISMPDGGIGMRLDGFLGSATSGEENGGDPVRWHFGSSFIQVSRVGGIGLDIGFADQNTFQNLFFSAYGTANGNQRSIRIRGVQTVPGGFKFPQNIQSTMTDLGQQLPVEVDDSASAPGGGHCFGDMTMFDEQVPLGFKERKYIRGRTIMPGDFPYGGWVNQQGPVTGRFFHNKLLNPTFGRQTRGSSGTITNGGFGPDNWLFSFDGSITATWSLEAVDPYFTDSEGDPLFKLRIAVTAASGNTYFYMGQRVRDRANRARLYTGCYTTMSGLWRQNAGSAVSLVATRVEQYFGTGGSPSTTAAVTQTSPQRGQSATLSSTWKGLNYLVQLPSVTGKTFGSNSNDYLNVYWSLPINTTYEIELLIPQWELGMGFSVFDMRPTSWDDIECSRTLRKFGVGVNGLFAGSLNTSSFAVGASFDIPMLADPTLTAISASAVVSIPGNNVYTDSGTTAVSGTTLKANGVEISIVPGGTWSATPTAFRPGILRTDLFLLSAE